MPSLVATGTPAIESGIDEADFARQDGGSG